jgi:cytochrome o ubiquinol oxidase subunit 1
VIPVVDDLDPLWAIKRGVTPPQPTQYEDIYMPKNTPMGLFIGVFSLIFGFAMTWHIMWMAIISFIAIAVCLIIRLSGKDEHELITAAQVKETENAYRRRQEAL